MEKMKKNLECQSEDSQELPNSLKDKFNNQEDFDIFSS